jgi:malate dehydrogenase
MIGLIAIIGAGRVGTAAAIYISMMELDDIVLIDIIKGRPQGEALDLAHALSILGKSINIYGSNDYRDISGAEIVLITAGFPRGPGMTREELVAKNAEVVIDIAKNVLEYAPKAVNIITTNPLDAMVYLLYKVSSLPREMVIGFSGVLDAGRMRYYISRKLSISPSSIEAIVVGQHGEKMLPLPRLSTVMGKPLTEMLSKQEIEEITRETVQAGAKIIELRGYSSSYGPGAGLAMMAEAIKKDQNKVFLASVCLEGEYGYRDVCVSLPAVLGRGGVKKILELPLTSEERQMFDDSVRAIKANIAQIPPKYLHRITTAK